MMEYNIYRDQFTHTIYKNIYCKLYCKEQRRINPFFISD